MHRASGIRSILTVTHCISPLALTGNKQANTAVTAGFPGAAAGLQLEPGLAAGPARLQRCHSAAAQARMVRPWLQVVIWLVACMPPTKAGTFVSTAMRQVACMLASSAGTRRGQQGHHHERHRQEVDPVLLQPGPVVGRRRLLVPPLIYVPGGSALGAWARLLPSRSAPWRPLSPPLPCTTTQACAPRAASMGEILAATPAKSAWRKVIGDLTAHHVIQIGIAHRQQGVWPPSGWRAPPSAWTTGPAPSPPASQPPCASALPRAHTASAGARLLSKTPSFLRPTGCACDVQRWCKCAMEPKKMLHLRQVIRQRDKLPAGRHRPCELLAASCRHQAPGWDGGDQLLPHPQLEEPVGRAALLALCSPVRHMPPCMPLRLWLARLTLNQLQLPATAAALHC